MAPLGHKAKLALKVLLACKAQPALKVRLVQKALLGQQDHRGQLGHKALQDLMVQMALPDRKGLQAQLEPLVLQA
jgi:hypothetical protein